MATPKKVSTTEEWMTKVKNAKSMVFAEYAGIKHKQLETLRKAVKKLDGEFVVTKNTLMVRALGDQASSVKEHLKSATATLFAYSDEVAPLKELLKFFKAQGMGKTKGGLLGKTVLTTADVTKLSELPSKEVLLGKLVGQLNAPIQGLHYALSWNINKLVWALEAVRAKKA